MKVQNNDFSQGSMPRNMLQLAIPMTLAQLINVLYNVVDRMYIGHIPETGMISLTGLGVTFPLIMIVSGLHQFIWTGRRSALFDRPRRRRY